MHAAIIAPLFTPEFGAAVIRIESFARKLTESGHRVTVVTGMPNYPAGKPYPGYERRLFVSEDVAGVRVLRSWYYMVPRNKSKLRQLISYLSLLPGLVWGGLRAGRPDVVFVTSPPLFNVLPAMLLSKCWGARLVVDLRDLWPDEFFSIGVASERSLFVRLLRFVERRAYRSASAITCTTHAFMDEVAKRGAGKEKLQFIPNGADLEMFTPHSPTNPIAAELPLGDKFVVMYSGLLGLKHGLDLILDVAKSLQAHPEILFFIRGIGPHREALIQRVQDWGLTNVSFGGAREIEDVPYILARANIGISSLLPDEYFDKIISIKLFEYMACGVPVVAAVRGEGAKLLQDSGAGIATPPGDVQAMADAILRLYNDRPLLGEMASRGRPFMQAHYSRDVTAQKLVSFLETLVGQAVVRQPAVEATV